MKRLLALCFACSLVLPLAAVGAGDWPVKPVRIIVPFAAGGAADQQGRLYGDALSAASALLAAVMSRATLDAPIS